MNKSNVFLGLIGCVVFLAGAILSAVWHHYVPAVTLALFAVIYIWRTALLMHRARRTNSQA